MSQHHGPEEEIHDNLVTQEGARLFICGNDKIHEAMECGLEVERRPGKHDHRFVTYVVAWRGETYKFTVEISYQHGMDHDEVELEPCVAQEVMVVRWVDKPRS